jgi:hypothetical protein
LVLDLGFYEPHNDASLLCLCCRGRTRRTVEIPYWPLVYIHPGCSQRGGVFAFGLQNVDFFDAGTLADPLSVSIRLPGKTGGLCRSEKR